MHLPKLQRASSTTGHALLREASRFTAPALIYHNATWPPRGWVPPKFFRKNVEQKGTPTGQNSIIAQHSAYEYQMDILIEQKFYVGVLMIDVVEKFMHVVPVKSKTEATWRRGMIEGPHQMGKKPKIVYTDDGGALNKQATQRCFKDENIQHHRTRAHPSFSERAIRTFKDMLYTRVEADATTGASRGIRDEKREGEFRMDGLHPRNITSVQYTKEALGNGIYPKRSAKAQQ